MIWTTVLLFDIGTSYGVNLTGMSIKVSGFSGLIAVSIRVTSAEQTAMTTLPSLAAVMQRQAVITITANSIPIRAA